MTDGPTTDAILQMAMQMGKVVGTVEQVDKRVGEVADAVRDLAESNGDQHRQTADQLAKIERRLAEGDRRFDAIEADIKELKTKIAPKTGTTPHADSWWKSTGEKLGWLKTWGTAIILAIMTVYYYITTGQPPKGGSAP